VILTRTPRGTLVSPLRPLSTPPIGLLLPLSMTSQGSKLWGRDADPVPPRLESSFQICMLRSASLLTRTWRHAALAGMSKLSKEDYSRGGGMHIHGETSFVSAHLVNIIFR
jgi:hypothetical protein